MQFRTLLCLAIALLGVQPLVAQAGPCDAHFTFDGNLADASGNGYDGIATGPAATSEKTAARLPYIMSFEQGRSGQALKLDGTTAVRVPLDLSIEGCPKITITAWVKFDDNPTKGSQYILSSGPGGPGLVRDGTNLSVYGGEKRYRQSKALRGGSWEFIAASLDYEAGKMTVHWRNRVSDVDIKARGTKQADVWIGAYDDNARMAVQSGLIDDLRVTAGILTAEQISQLRNNVGQAAAAQRSGDQMNPNLGLWAPSDQNNPAQIPGDDLDPVSEKRMPDLAVPSPTILDSVAGKVSGSTGTCASNAECPTVNGRAGVCYAIADTRASCYSRCQADEDCSSGDSCLDVTLPSGTIDSVCMAENSG